MADIRGDKAPFLTMLSSLSGESIHNSDKAMSAPAATPLQAPPSDAVVIAINEPTLRRLIRHRNVSIEDIRCLDGAAKTCVQQSLLEAICPNKTAII
jgi:hypothetical protein